MDSNGKSTSKALRTRRRGKEEEKVLKLLHFSKDEGEVLKSQNFDVYCEQVKPLM